MLGAALLQRVFQIAQHLLLFFGQPHGNFHPDVAVQVARVTRAHPLDPLAAQAERLAVLRALRDLDADLLGQGNYLQFASERCGRHRDGHLTVQVVAVALEHLVLLDPDFHVQVARRPAIRARLALARQADPLSLVDAGRNADLEHLVALDAPVAVAGQARFRDHAPAAVAGRAGLLDREKPLGHPDRAGAAAGAAGLRLGAWARAAAAARFAVIPGRNADVGAKAACSLLQRDFHVVAQVGPAECAARTTAARAGPENVAEDVAEGLGETTHAGTGRRPRVRIDTSVTEAVVGRALLGIRQDFVGLLGLLELSLGVLVLVVRIAIRVVLHRELAIRLLDLLIGGVLGKAEDLVEIALGHIPSVESKRPAARLDRACAADRRIGRGTAQPRLTSR